jgi:transketolase
MADRDLSNYVGMTGAKIGIHTFGSSAPLKDLLKRFGFTPERVLEAVQKQLAQVRKSHEPA